MLEIPNFKNKAFEQYIKDPYKKDNSNIYEVSNAFILRNSFDELTNDYLNDN